MRLPSTTHPQRHIYIEALRLLAAFFVIVNHTNSAVFLCAGLLTALLRLIPPVRKFI